MAGPLRSTGDRGSVTAELAVGLVGVVLGLALVLSVALAASAQVAAAGAAAAGARAAARGQDLGAVVRAAQAVVGPGASVAVRTDGDLVRVTVHRAVPLLLPGRPRVDVQASSAALVEPAGSEPVDVAPVDVAPVGEGRGAGAGAG